MNFKSALFAAWTSPHSLARTLCERRNHAQPTSSASVTHKSRRVAKLSNVPAIGLSCFGAASKEVTKLAATTQFLTATAFLPWNWAWIASYFNAPHPSQVPAISGSSRRQRRLSAREVAAQEGARSIENIAYRRRLVQVLSKPRVVATSMMKRRASDDTLHLGAAIIRRRSNAGDRRAAARRQRSWLQKA